MYRVKHNKNSYTVQKKILGFWFNCKMPFLQSERYGRKLSSSRWIVQYKRFSTDLEQAYRIKEILEEGVEVGIYENDPILLGLTDSFKEIYISSKHPSYHSSDLNTLIDSLER